MFVVRSAANKLRTYAKYNSRFMYPNCLKALSVVILSAHSLVISNETEPQVPRSRT